MIYIAIIKGTCAAANYTDGCCQSGLCRGYPPTCSCDPLCSTFDECCADFTPCPQGLKPMTLAMLH